MKFAKYLFFITVLLVFLAGCNVDKEDPVSKEEKPVEQSVKEESTNTDVTKVVTEKATSSTTTDKVEQPNAIFTADKAVSVYQDEDFQTKIGTLFKNNHYLVKEELIDSYSIKIENHLGYIKREDVTDSNVEEIENKDDKEILHIATNRATPAYKDKDKKDIYYIFEDSRRIPVYAEDRNFYAVKVAKKLVYIEKKQVKEDKGIPVLMYHHMLKNAENSNPSNGMVVPVENFTEQMNYLDDANYETISLDDLYLYLQGEKNLSTNAIAITFDDGLKSNYLYAYPILKKHNFIATNFIITSRFNDTPSKFNPETLQFMSKPEGAEMKGVFNLEGHTHRLHAVKEGKAMLVSYPRDFIKDDLTESKKILPQNFFAYPFGAYDEQAIEILKELDYKMAVTTKPGRVQKGDNLFELKRIGIGPSHSLAKFKKAVER